MLSGVCFQRTSLLAATNQSTGYAVNAHSAFCTDGWRSPMRVLDVTADAHTAAEMQFANATLLQTAMKSLLRSGIAARMRQALMHTLLDQIRIYGGILQAEAAGSRVLMNARATGYKDSSALQRKSLESFHDHLRLQCMLTVDLHPHLFIKCMNRGFEA